MTAISFMQKSDSGEKQERAIGEQPIIRFSCKRCESIMSGNHKPPHVIPKGQNELVIYLYGQECN
jgi:hypothetical protein